MSSRAKCHRFVHANTRWCFACLRSSRSPRRLSVAGSGTCAALTTRNTPHAVFARHTPPSSRATPCLPPMCPISSPLAPFPPRASHLPPAFPVSRPLAPSPARAPHLLLRARHAFCRATAAFVHLHAAPQQPRHAPASLSCARVCAPLSLLRPHRRRAPPLASRSHLPPVRSRATPSLAPQCPFLSCATCPGPPLFAVACPSATFARRHRALSTSRPYGGQFARDSIICTPRRIVSTSRHLCPARPSSGPAAPTATLS
ncbi:hypothetical protein DENSPDRAFT_886643 [Dentipellis sp. KUC8613]|nr:hypothetical protein DENSPDRAFT_886643 [Dentipellis sp. KUC8613]